MTYDFYCGKCSSGIKCKIYNKDTEETITIDESYDDVKKLYELLTEFFLNDERTIVSEGWK